MTKFEVGRTYQTRSICDHDCIYSWTVVARTAKTVRMVNDHNSQAVKTLRVAEYRGAETVKPYGTYSMCPVLVAGEDAVAA